MTEPELKGNGSQEYPSVIPAFEIVAKSVKVLNHEEHEDHKGKDKLFSVLFVVSFFSGPFATTSFETVAKVKSALPCRHSRKGGDPSRSRLHLSQECQRVRIVWGLSPFQRPRRIDNNTPFHQTGTESTDEDHFSRCFTI